MVCRVLYGMTFAYINRRFRGDGIQLWCSKGNVYIQIKKRIMKLGTWDDTRELMYKLEEIAPEAVLYNKRTTYGKDLAVYPDEGEWVLWWRCRALEMDQIMMRSLPSILRFFVRKYHKLMLDYNNYKLKEGFEVDIPTFFKYIRD